MSLIYQTVHQKSTNAPPSGSWRYLAGTTAINTITNSAGNPLNTVEPFNASSPAANLTATYNNNLVVALNDDNCARVFKRNADNSWTNLGDPNGLSTGIQRYAEGYNGYVPVNVSKRQVHGLIVFNGDLYVCFTEEATSYFTSATSGFSSSYGYISRWNSANNSWTLITTNYAGINGNHQNPFVGLPGFTSTTAAIDLSHGTFSIINNNLYWLSSEVWTNWRALVATDYYNVTAAQISPTVSIRQSQYSDGQWDSINYGSTTFNNNTFIYIYGAGNLWRIFKFDGAAITRPVNTTTAPWNNFMSVYTNGFSLQKYNGNLRLIYNKGLGTTGQPYSPIYIRESSDGINFSSVGELSPPTDYFTLQGAVYIGNRLFIAASYTYARPSPTNIFRVRAFYRDASNFTPGSNTWSLLGGGNPNTQEPAGFSFYKTQSSIITFKNYPAIFFEQGSDSKLYIATSKP